MKKRGYYIHFNARQTTGVSRKIDGTLSVFRKSLDVEEIVIKLKTRSYIRNAGSLLPLGSLLWDYEAAERQMRYAPDFLYVRKPYIDRRGYLFFRMLKKKYPKCKIVFETDWPYFWTVMHSIYFMTVIKDRFYCKRLKEQTGRYALYIADTKYAHISDVMGVPAIRIKNGIIVDEINYSGAEEKETDVLHLIAVSHMEPHHGYERILKGMNSYYKNGGQRPIMLHFVGEGTEKKKYESLTMAYQLTNRVIFHGELTGSELEKVYYQADIGLGSFGWYKDGRDMSSNLKMREYLAYGLPVISGCVEDFAEDDQACFFFRQFSNDSSDIDMEQVLSFYDEINGRYQRAEIKEKVHQYAKDTVDMDTVMKPVVEYLLGEG